MISGIVTRCVNAVERRMKSEQGKTEWTFSKKCHCNTDLYIFSICDRTVWIVGCCKTGICVPWICSIYHIVYSIYHSCDRDKRKRDLKFIMKKLGLTIFPRKARKIRLKIKKRQ